MITENLEQTIQRAMSYATDRQHQYATLEHFLLALIDDKDAVEVLEACKINLSNLRANLTKYLDQELKDIVSSHSKKTEPSASFERVLQRAAIHMQSSDNIEINGASVLVSLFSERESHAVYFLQKQEMTRLDAINFISHGIEKNTDQHDEEEQNNENIFTYINPSDLKENKSTNNNFVINLNERAKKGKIDKLIGRKYEIERTLQTLCRRTKNNPLFVGESGVGKTAIVEGLALKIYNKKVPNFLQKSTIFLLDLAGMLAGTRYRGDFEERFKKVIEEIIISKNNILFIDEIHTIVGAGATSGGSMDASNILKPFLSNGLIRCIGSTTYKEYTNYLDKDKAFSRRFQKIDIAEPSKEDCLEILKGIKSYYEKFHNLVYSDESLKSSITLSNRYLTEKKLPDKAIDLIDEVGAFQRLFSKTKKRKIIQPEDIQDIVSKIARIPLESLNNKNKDMIKNIDKNLKDTIYGQDKAINNLTRSIKLSHVGLSEPEKPIGCFLFTGPSGVGKTELAKQLANSLKVKLIRFDMSEYSERHSVSRLIGSPPGYVGFDQGGLLTDLVDQNPHSVILLDEIEKAHPDLFNILLQVMDYGKLTDNSGKSINFKNTILIMTTNIGTENLTKNIPGFANKKQKLDNDEEIKFFFKPEFRNRLDSIILFNSLSQEVIYKIVNKFIFDLEAQLAEKNISIELSDRTRKWLVIKGFSEVYGARPLARLIKLKIKEPIADYILSNRFNYGETIKIQLINNKLSFDFKNFKNSKKKKKIEVC